MHYYNKTPEEVLKDLRTSKQGITNEEAENRVKLYGYNEIVDDKKISPLKIFIYQFNSPLIWILIVAMIISLLLNEYTDGIVIGIILVLNALFGFFQEFKAEKAIDALRKMSALKAKVIRHGNLLEIDTKFLVPGDIILLETGDKVPADSRIFSQSNLEIQESVLTGESMPVSKNEKTINGELGLGDRLNMVYSTTIVTKGRCKAIVTHTGRDSEVGKIAKMIQSSEEGMTPLQIKLRDLAKWLGIIVLFIAVVVFITGILRSGMDEHTVLEMFIVAVALAVAAIPEGLPAVVTVSLGLGVKKMVQKNALVRKLASVETLGACSVICTDKTGTLTHNEMTVKAIFANNEITLVDGAGYKPQGNFNKDSKKIHKLLIAGVLCNDSKIVHNNEEYEVVGDPTEGCLIVSGMKAGINQVELFNHYPRIDEIPFSSERKMMTTIHNVDGIKTAYSKGAPDILLEKCDKILMNGAVRRLTKDMKEHILNHNEEFASKALRILGFAYKEFKGKSNSSSVEDKMTFLGLQGMIDPPREEVKDAILRCKKAGIKVVMITGDHKTTAVAIARELGMEGNVLTGKELENIDLKDVVESVSIYARVDPKHKSKIVDAFQSLGHIIAMTGDGVNDAPALKEADIGISMGITGTDVAKEASDMILTDDNFTSIVGAVEGGRTIFDNIKKFVSYLLSANAGEVLTIFSAMLIGLKLPLLAIQILWINLVTDGLPALALGMEPSEKNIMERLPRNTKEKIVSEYEIKFILLMGFVIASSTIGIFVFSLYSLGWKWGLSPAPEAYLYATSMAFCTLMLSQMFNVLNNRSQKTSITKINFFSNKFVIIAIISSIILQVAVVSIPFLTHIFKTAILSIKDWGIIFLVSSLTLIAGEIYKKVRK